MVEAANPVSYQAFTGVDIAYQTFTAATALNNQKPKLAAKPFPQDSKGFSQFIQQLEHSAKGVAAAQHLVVMEATGAYWVALALALTQAGLAVSVINPAQAHFFAKAQLKQVKSDAADALTLSEFAQSQWSKLRLWSPPPQFYHELRQRLAQRDSLTSMRGQVQNQLHALKLNPVVIASVQAQLEQLLSTLKNQLKQIDEELEALLEIDFELKLDDGPATETDPTAPAPPPLSLEQQWKKNIALLRTITGIGPLTAAWLVVATLNFSTCNNVEALVRYVGLAPMEYSSGSSIRGRPQIGHAGHTRLRSLLYLASLSASRFNAQIKAFWQRLRQDKHKPYKVARCACARKLLHLAWGVIKRGQRFDPNYVAQPA
jgi:transposase